MSGEVKTVCDGCKRVIRGTEKSPANVWSTYDDKQQYVELCDRCSGLYCNDCGASLFRGDALYDEGWDGAYYCNNSLCGPDEEEGAEEGDSI